MPLTRKSHPPSLKAKVAIEANRNTAQIAQMFGVHPTQVGGWKRQAAGRPAGRVQQRPRANPSAAMRTAAHSDIKST